MAYIGKSPQVGNYVKLDAISTSSTNTYNLTQDSVAFVPESALHMLVSLNGVIQSPLSSFSVSGSTITFLPSSGTLSSSDTIDFIMVLGNTLDIGTPSDSTVTNAKTNFVSTSSSAGLQIKGDNTTAGTLQLNCEQNSHGIKLKSPAHSAGQSYTLTFPTTAPVADKALITDGSGNLSFGTAGAYVKLASTTISSAVAQIAFDSSVITSTYDTYHVIVSNISSTTSNDDIGMRASVDNGSNIISSIGNMHYSLLNGTDNGRDYNRNYHVIAEDTEEDATQEAGISGFFTIFRANSTSHYKHVIGWGLTENSGTAGNYYGYRAYSIIPTASALNYIKIFSVQGNNLDSGKATIYGVET